MRAIEIRGDELVWTEQPDPQPSAGEVLIDVAAAGVNRADLLQRAGHYPPPPGASPILGMECSGTIAAVGADVTGHRVGDPVCALLAGGGYAERVAVPQSQLLPVPDGVSLIDAAALPEAACTVWSTMFTAARAAAGEWVLIHGGGGGIGSFAIQLAVARGLSVAVTAGSDEALRRCADLGASVLVNYRTDDFVEVVQGATDGRGVDVILDVVGAKYLPRNVSALADGGRLAIIGMQGGTRAEIDLGQLLSKRRSVIGTTLRSRPVTGRGSKAEVVADVIAQVWPLVESGAIRATVGARIPIEQAGRAHELMQSEPPGGKILLTVG